jgi:pyruvate,water dikinase
LLIRRSANGGTEQVSLDDGRAQALCLKDHHLLALNRLTERCEAAYGGPQDLEWALAGVDLFLL